MARTEPLRVMFLLTSMPVGGAETLLVNLVRRMDRSRFAPEICCLKERGPLGEELAAELPVHADLLGSKWDVSILWRLAGLFAERRIDAIVTVGAGDKMFWGRLAAWWAGVPVVCSALHSTGWPDGVGLFNRWLTPITDAFIGVATEHGRFLREEEKFPAAKVVVIPNGVNVDRFAPRPDRRIAIRAELGIEADAPVAGILAALRPEKNHELFLRAAARVRQTLPNARFVVIGEGPERPAIEGWINELGLGDAVLLLGNRSDVPDVLAALDVLALTSHMEANPVSILEAMSVGLPIVATDVGSVHESVQEGVTGFLVPPGDEPALAARLTEVLSDRVLAAQFGRVGREHVIARASLGRMVEGYEELLTRIYEEKTGQRLLGRDAAPTASPQSILSTR